jgi:hypothetical protein
LAGNDLADDLTATQTIIPPSDTETWRHRGPERIRSVALLSWGEVFLAFEGDPFSFEQGLEYLIGTATAEDDEPQDNAIWSFDPAQEKTPLCRVHVQSEADSAAVSGHAHLSRLAIRTHHHQTTRVVMGRALMKSMNCCARKCSWICFAIVCLSW